MTVDLEHPELVALIQMRMRTGRFSTVEDALIDALKVSASVGGEVPAPGRSGRTGSALVAAMQACPFQEVEIEPARMPMPMREVRL